MSMTEQQKELDDKSKECIQYLKSIGVTTEQYKQYIEEHEQIHDICNEDGTPTNGTCRMRFEDDFAIGEKFEDGKWIIIHKQKITPKYLLSIGADKWP